MGNCCSPSHDKHRVLPTDETMSQETEKDGSQPLSLRLSRMPIQLRSIDPISQDNGNVEIKQSESNYWSDLNASLKTSSWKEMQISSLFGIQFSGGMHRVPSHGSREKKK